MTRLLVGISGSLGVLSMPSYLVAIRSAFPELKVIMTHSATHFISAETLNLIVPEVYTKEFPLVKGQMGHIELARWADLFVILPATAHLLSQVAQGAADTLLTAAVLSYEREVIFFPNMNKAMWANPAVQRNVRTIASWGHRVVPPIEKLAFESASSQLEVHPVMPSVESVISLLKLETEIKEEYVSSR